MDDNDDIFTIELDDDKESDFYELEYDGDDEEVDQENRESRDTPFEITDTHKFVNGEEKHAELLRLRDSICRMNRGPVQNRFLKQAIKFEDVIAQPCERTPFSCYWPTYEAMSEDQLAWYFYWRSCVRKNDYKRTDLSYIFIYIYELINNVGVKNGEDGFIKLCSVWDAFRSIYPALDKYIVSWVQDYYLINCKNGLPDSVFAQLNPEIVNLLPESVVAEYMMNTGKLFSAEYISRFSNYKFTESRFYLNEKGKIFVENISFVLSSVNELLLKQNGIGIFKMFKADNSKGRSRLPYQNAVYQGPVGSLPVNSTDPAKNRDLRIFITSIIKQCENCCREIAGFRGRLGGIELPDDIKQHIKNFILAKVKKVEVEKRVNINIDKNKIKQLTEDSDIVLEKLLSDTDIEYEQEIPENENDDTESLIKTEEIETDDLEKESAQAEPDYQEVTIDNILMLLAPSLSDAGKNILRFLVEHNSKASTQVLNKEFSGTFLETEIDNINDAAIDVAGDIILFVEDDIVKLEI